MARWYNTGGLFADDSRIRCSKCEFDLYDCVHGGSANIEKFKYCPNCGAKMEQKIKMSFKINSTDDFVEACKKIVRKYAEAETESEEAMASGVQEDESEREK